MRVKGSMYGHYMDITLASNCYPDPLTGLSILDPTGEFRFPDPLGNTAQMKIPGASTASKVLTENIWALLGQ